MEGVGMNRVQSILVARWTFVRARYSVAVLGEQA